MTWSGPLGETLQEGLGRHGGPQGLHLLCLTNAGSFGNLFPVSVTDAVTKLMAAPAGALVWRREICHLLKLPVHPVTPSQQK